MALSESVLSQIHALQEACAREGDVLLVALTPLQAGALMDAVGFCEQSNATNAEHQGVMNDAADVLAQVLQDYEEMS